MFLRNYKYTIIVGLVVLIVVGYIGYKWYGEKMKLVERGVADPKFPYHEYTLLELVRVKPVGDFNDEDRAKFMQQLKNLPTRTMPQETFDMYIRALREGDIEKALECCIEKEPKWDPRGKEIKDIWVSWEVKESDRRYLYDLKEEGKLEELIKFLEQVKARVSWNSENIEKDRPANKTEVYYKFSCIYDESDTCGIGFIKSLYGDWELTRP